MIAQQILPSSTPYTILDYGVTAMVLVVMGIVLWFTFRTMAKVLEDHAAAMAELTVNIRMMKEELLTLVVDTRHLHESVTELERDERMKSFRTRKDDV